MAENFPLWWKIGTSKYLYKQSKYKENHSWAHYRPIAGNQKYRKKFFTVAKGKKKDPLHTEEQLH